MGVGIVSLSYPLNTILVERSIRTGSYIVEFNIPTYLGLYPSFLVALSLLDRLYTFYS